MSFLSTFFFLLPCVNEAWGKVMFLPPVCFLVHGGGVHGRGTCVAGGGQKMPVTKCEVCIILECILVTARVAKRAKVMFSQASVCPTPGEGEGVDNLARPGSKVTTPPPRTTPPPWPGSKVTTPPSSPDYAQAGGTHPTGMHSCFCFVFTKKSQLCSLC